MLPCLTLHTIRYESRVECSIPGKGVAPSPILCAVAIEKEALDFAHGHGHRLYLYINICMYVGACVYACASVCMFINEKFGYGNSMSS